MEQNKDSYKNNKSSSGQQDIYFDTVANPIEIIVGGILKGIWRLICITFKKFFSHENKSNQIDKIREYYLQREK